MNEWLPVEQILEQLGLSDRGILPSFKEYARLLLDYNQHTNLTSHTTIDEVALHHFADSLQVLRRVEIPEDSAVVDVGSGAGFPGLVLVTARPDLRLTIIESKRKATDFLRTVADALELRDVVIETARVEELSGTPAHRECYDLAVSRALAKPPTACEYLLPLVRVGGRVCIWVGPSFQESDVRPALEALGGTILARHAYALEKERPGRGILEVGKTSETPGRFPRRPGMAKKRPLQ